MKKINFIPFWILFSLSLTFCAKNNLQEVNLLLSNENEEYSKIKMKVFINDSLYVKTVLDYSDVSSNYEIHKIKVKPNKSLIKTVINDTIVKEKFIEFNLGPDIFIILSENLSNFTNNSNYEEDINGKIINLDNNYEVKIILNYNRNKKIW